MRPSGRRPDQLRQVTLETGVSAHAEGSCLVKFGRTHVLCTASLETGVPPFLKGSGKGWVTAQYVTVTATPDVPTIGGTPTATSTSTPQSGNVAIVQQQLNVRDHIMGLEAAAATAQARTAKAEQQLKGAMKRLARKNERIKELADQVARLQGEPRPDLVRGALNKLRRGDS